MKNTAFTGIISRILLYSAILCAVFAGLLTADAPACAQIIQAYTIITVSINPSGGGTVTASDYYILVDTNIWRYVKNEDVTLEATPNSGYKFVDWNFKHIHDGVKYDQNPITFPADSNHHLVTANFEEVPETDSDGQASDPGNKKTSPKPAPLPERILPEDEIGAYTLLEDGTKEYLLFHTYDICMAWLANDALCAGPEKCYHKDGK